MLMMLCAWTAIMHTYLCYFCFSRIENMECYRNMCLIEKLHSVGDCTMRWIIALAYIVEKVSMREATEWINVNQNDIQKQLVCYATIKILCWACACVFVCACVSRLNEPSQVPTQRKIIGWKIMIVFTMYWIWKYWSEEKPHVLMSICVSVCVIICVFIKWWIRNVFTYTHIFVHKSRSRARIRIAQ